MKGFMSFLLALVLMLQCVYVPVLAQEVDDGVNDNERLSPSILQEEHNVRGSTVLEGASLDESEYEDITAAFVDPNFLEVVQEAIGDFSGTIYRHQVEWVDFISAYDRDIESLAGIEYFTNLGGLDCGNNQLVELDVSNNLDLRSLYCSNNKLTELDVSHNLYLEVLDCADNQLTKLDVSGKLYLEGLYCENNQLMELDVSNNLDLRSLDCSDNKLTELDVSNNLDLEFLQLRSIYHIIKAFALLS